MNHIHEIQITKVINKYGLAMDARRWDVFDEIFVSDATIDYMGRLWPNLAAFKSDFERDHRRFDATQHAMMGHLVEVDGARAAAFTYCSWRLIGRGIEGGDFLEGTAWYDDALILTDEGWRIRKRRCRILWASGNPLVVGASEPMAWHGLRQEAAEGKVGYLRAIDARSASRGL